MGHSLISSLSSMMSTLSTTSTLLLLALSGASSTQSCMSDGSTPPDCSHDPETPLYQPHEYDCSLFWQCTPSSSTLTGRQSQRQPLGARTFVTHTRSAWPGLGTETGRDLASSSPSTQGRSSSWARSLLRRSVGDLELISNIVSKQ